MAAKKKKVEVEVPKVDTPRAKVKTRKDFATLVEYNKYRGAKG